jgi:amidohydrolase family protein
MRRTSRKSVLLAALVLAASVAARGEGAKTAAARAPTIDVHLHAYPSDEAIPDIANPANVRGAPPAGAGVLLPRAEFHAYLGALMRAGFGKRLMFGSDQMYWPEGIGLAVEGVESAKFLTAERKRDIFYNNAVRFFRLEPAPTGGKP